MKFGPKALTQSLTTFGETIKGLRAEGSLEASIALTQRKDALNKQKRNVKFICGSDAGVGVKCDLSRELQCDDCRGECDMRTNQNGKPQS